MTKHVLAIALLSLIAGCTNSPQPTAAPAAKSSEFKNLQVLPQDITREQLLTVMRSFTRGLGVRCNHCHVVTATEPKEVLDFPADTKKEKQTARVMLRMTNEINATWMPRAGATAPMRVVCWTCHRGKTQPEAPPPPPEPRPGA